MRMILSIGRVAMDLEMQVQPKRKAKAMHMGDVEVHEIGSDSDVVAPHIIGFIPSDDEDGDE